MCEPAPASLLLSQACELVARSLAGESKRAGSRLPLIGGLRASCDDLLVERLALLLAATIMQGIMPLASLALLARLRLSREVDVPRWALL